MKQGCVDIYDLTAISQSQSLSGPDSKYDNKRGNDQFSLSTNLSRMSSNLHKRLMQSGLGGLPPRGLGPPRAGAGGARGAGLGHRRDYSPVSWEKYFGTQSSVTLDNGDVFSVYERSSGASTNKGEDSNKVVPVVLLLHGGGFSALTW